MKIRWSFWPIFYKGNLKKLVYIVKCTLYSQVYICCVCGGQGNPQGQRAELSMFLQAQYFISSCKVPPSPSPLPPLFSFLLSTYTILFPSPPQVSTLHINCDICSPSFSKITRIFLILLWIYKLIFEDWTSLQCQVCAIQRHNVCLFIQIVL